MDTNRGLRRTLSSRERNSANGENASPWSMVMSGIEYRAGSYCLRRPASCFNILLEDGASLLQRQTASQLHWIKHVINGVWEGGPLSAKDPTGKTPPTTTKREAVG